MKKLSNNFISQSKGFETLKLKIHNTASAVFPVIISKKNDLMIIFFNYWLNKNKIEPDRVKFFARLYDQKGDMVGHFEKNISKYHNEISLKKFLESMEINNFIGSVNIEIISLEKLSFPFPAIVGVYRSNNLFSSVHSAGRLRNNSEVQKKSYTQETNWTCKFEKNINPFFHYFVGNNKPDRKYILVRLINKFSKIKKVKKIFINNINPFGSKIFFINEIFKKTIFDKDDFISVEVEHNSVFHRMVVGNYHKKLNFYEVTHSFPKIFKKEYCPSKDKIKYQSKITGSTNKDLDFSLELFPTNCDGKFKADFFKKNFNEKLQTIYKKDINFTKKNLKEKFVFKFADNEELKTIKMMGKKIPARLNTSFIYKVKNSKNNFTTDIADGARSSIFPKKLHHWGHGYSGNNFQSILTIINDNFDNKNPIKHEGVLSVYLEKLTIRKKIKINPGTVSTINLTKIKQIQNLRKKDKKFLSWMLKLKKPGCECFWISYRKKDGSIFGDHSF